MAFLGLDFGTTTSILSYMEGSELRPFHYGGRVGGTAYIPSVVAYLEKRLLIGPNAIEMLPATAKIYRYFKMLLPQEDKEKWFSDFGPYATETMEPAQVATDFIGELIRGSSPGRERLAIKEINGDAFLQRPGRRIDGLVVSVPQVWSRDASARGRQQLQKLVQDLNLPLMQLISEPVAAAAYFTYRYAEKQAGESYCGNLLICDMGGGTFDVSLCKLSKDRVEVLLNEGNGERGLGIAGAHFDLKLLKLKLGPNMGPELQANLLVKLDLEKRTGDNTNLLLRYLQISPQERVEPIYTFTSRLLQQTVSIRFEELQEAFATVREGIFQVLVKVKQEADKLKHPIDRVVMVGGFAQFPLVQQAVGEFFGEDVFDNPRLIDLDTFSRDEMAFAISHGACLVANDVIKVTERYDHTIGIVVYRGENERIELELIKAGKSLDSLEQTTFCTKDDGRKAHFRITENTVSVDIFIRLAGSPAESDRLVRKLSLTNVPNSNVENRWFVGTRVDKSKIPYLVLKDVRQGETKEYPLGDLIPPIIMED